MKILPPWVPTEQGGGVGRPFDHHRPGAVPEQHAGPAVGPVDDAAEGVAADEEDALDAAGDELHGGHQAVHEARAGGVHVDRSAREPQLVLDDRGAGRELLVGTAGGQEQEAHVGRVYTRHRQGVAPGNG
jgi:hypothetical protein